MCPSLEAGAPALRPAYNRVVVLIVLIALLALQPSARELYEKANALFSAGRFAECEPAIEQALRLDPQFVPALTLKAKLAMGANRFDVARQTLERAIAAEPGSWYGHFLYGFQFHLQNEMQRALPELEIARKLNPREARPVLYLALTHESLGDTGRALALYREAVRLEEATGRPRVETLLAYSRLLFVMDRREECGRLIARALAVDPDSRDAHYQHARLLLAEGDARAAAEAGERALRLPTAGVPDTLIRYVLIRAYRMLGDEARASVQAQALRDATEPQEKD